MKIKAVMNELNLKAHAFMCKAMPFFVAGFVVYCLAPEMSFASGVNQLAGLKDDVGATFGAGSDTQYFLLLAEGLAGAWAYIQTKNVMVLGGVPLLMTFTHFALK